MSEEKKTKYVDPGRKNGECFAPNTLQIGSIQGPKT